MCIYKSYYARAKSLAICFDKHFLVGQLPDNDEESNVSEDDASTEDGEHDGVEECQHLDTETSIAQEESDGVDNGILSMELDFEKDAEVARKVLDNLIKASASRLQPSQSDNPKTTESTDGLLSANSTVNKESIIPRKKSGIIESMDAKRFEKTAEEFNRSKSDLDRTIFISNLPFDMVNEEVKQRFSVFGEVQAFLPVLHHLTK